MDDETNSLNELIETSESLAENQQYDFITNQPVKDTPQEGVLQTIARALVDEYDFDHTSLQRELGVFIQVYDEHGKTCRVRRKVDVAVLAQDAPRDDQIKIIHACIIRPPGTKAGVSSKGGNLLEVVMGDLPNCKRGNHVLRS